MNTAFSSLRGQRVLVFGLGQFGGGVGTVRWLLRQGAHVTISDRRSADELKTSLRELSGLRFEGRFGTQSIHDLSNIDIVIANPGVPREHPVLLAAQRKHIHVGNIATLFFSHEHRPIVGVTGTRGKSSTSALITSFLRLAGRRAALVGQPGVSLLDATQKNIDVIVAELSSWQLEGLEAVRQSPTTAVVTNISVDHLNRYRSLRHYAAAKQNILRFQRNTDLAVLPRFDTRVRTWSSLTKAKVIWFSGQRSIPRGIGVEHGWYVERSSRGVRRLAPIESTHHMHMRENIAAALAAVSPYNIASKNIRSALQHVPTLPGRQEVIHRGLNRLWVNDTTATSPEGVRAALEAMPQPIVLIAGGQDKGLQFKAIAANIAKNVAALVLLPGTASDKMYRALPAKFRTQVVRVSTMREAVREAFAQSDKGSTILLSPGAASFNLFRHEFDRGEQFTQEVKALIQHHEKKR